MTTFRSPLRATVLRFALAVVVVLFCMAPTPGDIGGCGQRVQPLGPRPFFEAKKEIDCNKCKECSFSTDFCKTACDADEEVSKSFPEGCEPIVSAIGQPPLAQVAGRCVS